VQISTSATRVAGSVGEGLDWNYETHIKLFDGHRFLVVAEAFDTLQVYLTDADSGLP
jgi:hypothetical protein